MAAERRVSSLLPRWENTYDFTLGIDWGTDGVRADLHCHQNGHNQEVAIVPPPTMQDTLFLRHRSEKQFSSYIYPFDHSDPNTPGATVYAGNIPVPRRLSISSKFGMYAIVGTLDETIRHCSQIQELCDLVQQKPQLKQILRLGIEQAMLSVLKKVYEVLRVMPSAFSRPIGTIVLTVPAQWTMAFEEEYGERFLSAWDQVFDFEAPAIIFLNEGQTNLHFYLFRDMMRAQTERLGPVDQGSIAGVKRHSALLIFDAGRHSTNSSLVTISQDNHQLEARPDQAKEAWGNLFDFPFEAFPIEFENGGLKRFYSECQYYNGHNCATFSFNNFGRHRRSFRFDISGEKIVKAFEDANMHTFALIEQGVLELKNLQGQCEEVNILVGGGAALGCMWRARIARICEKYDMKFPVYLSKTENAHE
ncbi:hypothetical protein Daus18300_000510 [Diaporthe australafricana]|uniref:Actin-like ATPase domain-containing protein n=1 Tax=Diaporthe australafricana TaxID=127596 RepID=A0ABR3Y3I9_9PEZI